MLNFIFMIGGGKNTRCYKISKVKNIHNAKLLHNKFSRISLDEYESCVKHNNGVPNIGDKVTIIIKPYHLNNYKTGIIKNVLTKKIFHSRGHKCRLESGQIGRVIKQF